MQHGRVSGQSVERLAARSAPFKYGQRVIVNALGLAQIFAWGSSYYLLAVLAGPISRDLNWPLAWVAGGLSLGLLAGSVAAPRVGAAIERHGGRSVLAFSAVAIGMGQAGLAIALNLAVYALAWLVLGVGMAAGLYEANFAVLVVSMGQMRVPRSQRSRSMADSPARCAGLSPRSWRPR